ncbi:hypothetical protein [Microbispora sp. GKU 823]|uniref:hypothetical protein n=1 Tax=Microbispora sp. GKU 823 TaxID=1652100 RepID=UPI0009A3E2BD|nr:hypothetical protein [Microbispora sp. GKU 823]OPG10582.1 hypothetical protein B1L11_23270 [Microbispora sp. GKU 823]
MTAPAPSIRVPYITAWSDEEVLQNLAFRYHPEAGGLRLTYTDPQPTDWVYGVLRARHGLGRTGRIEWKKVNTLRQWRCMEHNLCQVCGRTALDEHTGRIWWVLTEADGTNVPEGYTNAPPTCRACLPEAIALCPRLRKSAAVYTARFSLPYAVLGTVFQPGTPLPVVTEDRALVLLEEFRRLHRTLAQQLVVTLADLRPEPLP